MSRSRMENDDFRTEQRWYDVPENTGRHFLDSGSAYGRHWERNHGIDFESQPSGSLEFCNRNGETEILATLNVFHFLKERLEYNPELDQIIISSPDLDEIFIIDHSTTTEEAAGHTGGRWGKGGDYLYRWGNPLIYGRGDTLDRKLGGQHDVQWIDKGLPGEGNILVFNNNVPNVERGFSSVLEIKPPLNNLTYEITDGNAFGPEEPSWKYIAADTFSFVSPFISGAHRLSNGNTFICQGPKGRFFEVTPSGEVVWDYMTPYSGDFRMPDGTLPQPVGGLVYATFRATHIPVDHPAIQGKDLAPLNPQPSPYTPEPDVEENN